MINALRRVATKKKALGSQGLKITANLLPGHGMQTTPMSGTQDNANREKFRIAPETSPGVLWVRGITHQWTFGGRVTCAQCNALSKRTRQKCEAPAVKGKTKCRFNGGAKDSGHLEYSTAEKPAERSDKLAELRELAELGFKVGLFASGTPRKRRR